MYVCLCLYVFIKYQLYYCHFLMLRQSPILILIDATLKCLDKVMYKCWSKISVVQWAKKKYAEWLTVLWKLRNIFVMNRERTSGLGSINFYIST